MRYITMGGAGFLLTSVRHKENYLEINALHIAVGIDGFHEKDSQARWKMHYSNVIKESAIASQITYGWLNRMFRRISKKI